MLTFNRPPGRARAAVLASARSWIGTPFRHQARARGVGCDCAGLVIAAGTESGAVDLDAAAWERFRNYARLPNPRLMGEALATFMVRHDGPPWPGDVCWLEWREGLPMHLAILGYGDGGRATLIHALESAGVVVEHGFAAEWPSRVVSWWRFPGLVR